MRAVFDVTDPRHGATTNGREIVAWLAANGVDARRVRRAEIDDHTITAYAYTADSAGYRFLDERTGKPAQHVEVRPVEIALPPALAAIALDA
jgi:hypothetical protein